MTTRANRVSINSTELGFEAKFSKTHDLVATIISTDTTWVADEKSNKTAQREAFRVWICDNSTAYGVEWLPDDMRSESNRRIPKYTSDDVLLEDVKEFLGYDIAKFWNEKFGSQEGLSYTLTGDSIAEVTKSAKGKDVTPKYGNGNWAWATIDALVTVKYGTDEVYVTMKCELVSGQLKKPSGIDGGAYSATGFASAVVKELNGLDAYVASRTIDHTADPEFVPPVQPLMNYEAETPIFDQLTGEDIRSNTIAERELAAKKESKKARKGKSSK